MLSHATLLSKTNPSTTCIFHFRFTPFDIESQHFRTDRNLELQEFHEVQLTTISLTPLLFRLLLPADTHFWGYVKWSHVDDVHI